METATLKRKTPMSSAKSLRSKGMIEGFTLEQQRKFDNGRSVEDVFNDINFD